MMPGVGFEEVILLVVVAIIVIGPKDLPLMMRKFGRFTGKMRAMAFEFKQGIDELGRQAELEELRKEVANLKAHTGLDEIRKELEDDRAGIEKDVGEVMALVPGPSRHPALAAAAAAPVIAPYAGLSPDHPGYDIGGYQDGEDQKIGGDAHEGANGVHVNGECDGEEAGAPYLIPEEDVPAAPVPVKQDTPA